MGAPRSMPDDHGRGVNGYRDSSREFGSWVHFQRGRNAVWDPSRNLLCATNRGNLSSVLASLGTRLVNDLEKKNVEEGHGSDFKMLLVFFSNKIKEATKESFVFFIQMFSPI